MARPLARAAQGAPAPALHRLACGTPRWSSWPRQHGVHLPEALVAEWPPRLSAADERGWFRFQRLYDIARSVVRTEADVRRLLAEAAPGRARPTAPAGWRSRSTRPATRRRFGGLTPTLELVLDAAARASAGTGVGIGVIVAANRTKHPLEARTLARLAAQYAGARA